MDKMLGKVRWADGCKHKCCVYPQHKSKTKKVEDRSWRQEWYDYLNEEYPYHLSEFPSVDIGYIPTTLPRETLEIREMIYGDPEYLDVVGTALGSTMTSGEPLWLDPLDMSSVMR